MIIYEQKEKKLIIYVKKRSYIKNFSVFPLFALVFPMFFHLSSTSLGVPTRWKLEATEGSLDDGEDFMLVFFLSFHFFLLFGDLWKEST